MKFADLTEAERQRLATCFHESAHAVAVLLAGGRVGVAEVYDAERDGKHGQCTYDDVTADAERAVIYAGAFAEVRHRYGAHPPLAEIRAVLAGTCDHAELTASGGGLAREVEPTLETVWPAVCSLAASLFRDGRADHDGVLAALGATSDDDLPMIRSLIKAKVWTPPTAA